MIKVLLVDDQNVLRAGLKGILETADDVIVSGEAGNGRDAVSMITALKPDVVLMDLRMPVLDGLGAIRELRADPRNDGVRILVLTTFEEDDNVVSAVRAGADGFVGKTIEPDELVEAVRSVARGDAHLSQAATHTLVRHTREAVEPAPPDGELLDRLGFLTHREKDVIIGVAEGLTNAEIGARLFIAQVTVKTHLNRAMVKLGVSDRAQIVVTVYRAGLLNK
ncbi:response regulator transcription factor [Arthrobacter sp. efr-133-TYG-118]|uniref:response regulator n=1 Tax=Arthrobacter sp. efr-133-TYG-118 TaxID=3040279 RepID=UPI0025517328|nr:response regulator transcription factor [Arthrobacter sp. efr-133-TYG-118]